MEHSKDQPSRDRPSVRNSPRSTCRSVDWYAEGDSRVVQCDGIAITVRYVGRKGRRGRIMIEAPAESDFS